MINMPKIEFSINLPSSSPERLIEIATDYDNITEILSGNIQCKVLERNNEHTITEEIIVFSTFNLMISQKSLHRNITKTKIETKIISGPLKGSLIHLMFEKTDSGTKVNINADLKLSLKYKISYFLLVKKYKTLTTKLIRRMNDLAILTEGKPWKDAFTHSWDHTMVLKNKSVHVKLYGWWTSDIKGVFLDKDYEFLPVYGRTVVDIGANIADSSIYFAICGADKVIAVEPFPKNYEWAKKNIQVNNLSDKIILLLAACTSKLGNITVNPETFGGHQILTEYERGVKISTITLENILDTYNLNSAVLKMDCEGCEYDVIKSSPVYVLQKFSHIEIEYHDGYNALKKKLEKANFEVPIVPKPMFGEKVGHLYAISLANNL